MTLKCCKTFFVFVPIAFIVFLCFCEGGRNATVHTVHGSFQGIIMTATHGRKFHAFLGIPYAEPPIGNLRFKAPVPKPKLSGTFKADNDVVLCPQIMAGLYIGDEDCLQLNVYTPYLPSTPRSRKSLPVMVYFHPGAFRTGFSNSIYYGPQRFLNKNIVLIAVAYRLGPLGFLSTGDAAASGNFGLLDQNVALRWIQKGISAFGGDPKRVTIFGQSAGASSSIYHTLSPLSKGLFRAAIAESGSPLSTDSYQPDPLSWAIKLGQLFNCSTTNTNALVDCLRKPTAEAIINAINTYLNAYFILNIPYLPVVENNKTGLFLTKPPEQLLQEQNFPKIPFISGVVKDEGALPYSSIPTAFNDLNETFYEQTLPYIIRQLGGYQTNLVNVSNAVKAQYFDKIDTNNFTVVTQTAIDMMSDLFKKAQNDKTVRYLANRRMPVYMYAFEYYGSASLTYYAGNREISHGAELTYLFQIMNSTALNSQDLIISNNLIEMWTNFAIYLDPTPKGSTLNFHWSPTPIGSIRYLHITDNFVMKKNYRAEQMDFWNNYVPFIVNYN